MFRLDDVEQKLAQTEKEAEKARKDSKEARDRFNDVKRRRCAFSLLRGTLFTHAFAHLRCELFNKAYKHISDQIDPVYKDLTKGKAAPMGGVAYLSLEDNEVGISFLDTFMSTRRALGPFRDGWGRMTGAFKGRSVSFRAPFAIRLSASAYDYTSPGTLQWRCQIPCNASNETVP